MFLMHHGVKGQKWGVRHQEKSISKKLKKNPLKEYPLNPSINVDKKTGDYIIKKGTKLYRVTTKKDEDDSKRIYASATKEGRKNYLDFAIEGQLWFKDSERNVFERTLQASKDMRVANVENVVGHIVDKYGDLKTSHRHEFLSNVVSKNQNPLDFYVNDEIKRTKLTPKELHTVQEYNNEISKFITGKMTNESISSEIFNHYKKKGYDAIVDPEDGRGDFGYDYKHEGYPIIILNPKNSVKTKKVQTISDAHEEWYKDYMKNKKFKKSKKS